MKNRMNQLLKDKLLLVMMVLGLLTIVAAAGAVRIRKGDAGNEEKPYLEAPETQGMMAEELPQNRVEETTGEKEPIRAAGGSDAEYASAETKEEASAKDADASGDDAADAAGAGALSLHYNGSERLSWPIRGNVLIDYSMETTTYFPTLDQYKCNPALIIQGDVSAPVTAPADALVTEVGTNEEIGNYVVLELGNEYSAVCGQLKSVQVEENQYVTSGSVLGYVAEPTKYYSVEGNNVYFELRHQGKPVDALDYLE